MTLNGSQRKVEWHMFKIILEPGNIDTFNKDQTMYGECVPKPKVKIWPTTHFIYASMNRAIF